MTQIAVEREDTREAYDARILQRVTELCSGQPVGDGDGDLVGALYEREYVVSDNDAVVAEQTADNEHGGDVYHRLDDA